MKTDFERLHTLVLDLVALQAKARELGVFANDRELLECRQCGLMENVACSGLLFTCHPESLDNDTGLRFLELDQGRFRCPSCGSTVHETNSTALSANNAKRKKRSCRPRKPQS